jgi:DNA-binding PadR family transcriptional regulator
MEPGDRPTTTEAALLGMLVLDGPRSPYDLVHAVHGSIGFFFAPARSHVYDVLPRLERHGWARHTVVAQASRPDKRVYRATAAGRRVLAAWVAKPDGPDTDPAVTIQRLQALRRLATEALDRYRAIEARNAGNDAELFPLLTLHHGIERTWSTIRWTDDALARLRSSVPEAEVVRSGPR